MFAALFSIYAEGLSETREVCGLKGADEGPLLRSRNLARSSGAFPYRESPARCLRGIRLRAQTIVDRGLWIHPEGIPTGQST